MCVLKGSIWFVLPQTWSERWRVTAIFRLTCDCLLLYERKLYQVASKVVFRETDFPFLWEAQQSAVFPRHLVILGMPCFSESKKVLWVSVTSEPRQTARNLFKSSHFTGRVFWSTLGVNVFFVSKVPGWSCTLGWNLKSFLLLVSTLRLISSCINVSKLENSTCLYESIF